MKHFVCVVERPGGHTAVRRGRRARVVPQGLPDHTGGGGGRQEHQQAGGKGDAHSVRHPQGMVRPCFRLDFGILEQHHELGRILLPKSILIPLLYNLISF